MEWSLWVRQRNQHVRLAHLSDTHREGECESECEGESDGSERRPKWRRYVLVRIIPLTPVSKACTVAFTHSLTHSPRYAMPGQYELS